MTKLKQPGGETFKKESINNMLLRLWLPVPWSPLLQPCNMPELPAQRVPFPSPSLPVLSQEAQAHRNLLLGLVQDPASILGPEPVPQGEIPCHMVHVLEPLLPMCEVGGQVPEGPQVRAAEHLRCPSLLFQEAPVPAGAAQPARRRGPGGNNDSSW